MISNKQLAVAIFCLLMAVFARGVIYALDAVLTLAPFAGATEYVEPGKNPINDVTQRPENVVTNQIVLAMLGASTFERVMTLRKKSHIAANSTDIRVTFSIIPKQICDSGSFKCVNTRFQVTTETFTHFYLGAVLVSNDDLNRTCEMSKNKNQLFFINYPGYQHLPADTAKFDKYEVRYKCGIEIELQEKLRAEEISMLTVFYLMTGLICFLIVAFSCLWFFVRFQGDRNGQNAQGDAGSRSSADSNRTTETAAEEIEMDTLASGASASRPSSQENIQESAEEPARSAQSEDPNNEATTSDQGYVNEGIEEDEPSKSPINESDSPTAQLLPQSQSDKD